MTQIIENWAQIRGIVKSIEKHNELDNYCQVHVEFKEANEVEGYPNLAAADVNSTMPVNIKSENAMLNNLTVGKEVSISVRKAFGQVYFIKE